MLKKLFFIFILSTFYSILNTSTIYALKFGPHMVCNTNPESFADVREQYNLINNWMGIANKIPVTIILQANMTAEQMTEIFIAARDNGIIPYIRLAGPGFWDQICENDIKKFAVNLNSALQNAGLSGIYIAPGNEVNRDDEWVAAGCGSKIDSLAKALNTLLDNAQNYKVAFPGFDLYYQGGNWRNFLTEFNNHYHSLLKRLDAFVIHSYTEISDRNPNKWHEEKNFLNSIGIYPKFLFYEANLHPGINASADKQAEYIQNVAFQAYSLDTSIEVVTPFSRAKPIINYASADNPYLMLVIKEDGSEAKFIEFPHPADNCGVGPNIILRPEIAAGGYIVHKKSLLTQILETLKIFIKGRTGQPENLAHIKSPDFSKVSQTLNKNDRLLPASLQKTLTRNKTGEVPVEYGFPGCNLEEDEAKKIEGKTTASLNLTNADISNALVLNDLLNTTSKNNQVIRKTNNPLNYVVEAEKPTSENELLTCSNPQGGSPVKETSRVSNKEKTRWEGKISEGERVLAATPFPNSSLLTVTPTPPSRTAKFEVINQAKTRTYLKEAADALSGTFGFLRALIPSFLAPPVGTAGEVKNNLKTEVEVPWTEETKSDVSFTYPRAAEMEQTTDLFQKMLLPQALQR